MMKTLLMIGLLASPVMAQTTASEYNACASYLCRQAGVSNAVAPVAFALQREGDTFKWAYWNIAAIPAPTLAEMEAVKVVAAQEAEKEDTDFTKHFARLELAFALVSMEHNNKNREWFIALKAAVAHASTLADIKTNIAALPDTPTNSIHQMIDAVRAKAKELP